MLPNLIEKMNNWQKLLTTMGVVSMASMVTPLGSLATAAQKGDQNFNLSTNQGPTLIAQQVCVVQGTPGSPTIPIRNTPNNGSDIGAFNVGTSVSVQNNSGGWVQAAGQGSAGAPISGWVWAAYLNCNGAANNNSRPLVGGSGRQTCQAQSSPGGEGPFIGVRDQPNDQGRKIGSFPNGTFLGIQSISPDNNWAMVSGPNLQGWVWRAYLINCR